MKKAITLTVITGMVLFAGNSCSKDSGGRGGGGGGGTTVNCTTVSNKAFNADVFPIFQSSCAIAGCHAINGNGPGALTNHAQISAAASSIRSAVSSGKMPQNSSLTSAQKNSIICWIDSGAPNN